MLLSQDYSEHKFFDNFFPSIESTELFKVNNEVLSA